MKVKKDLQETEEAQDERKNGKTGKSICRHQDDDKVF